MSPRPVIPEGMCRRCGARPHGATNRMCDRCNAHRIADIPAHRERNRRYEQRLRDRGMKTPRHLVEQQQADARRLRETALIAWAEVHGRVPTYAEVAEILGVRGSTGSELQRARRSAFGLRSLGRSTGANFRIPYPVPAEYQEEAAS